MGGGEREVALRFQRLERVGRVGQLALSYRGAAGIGNGISGIERNKSNTIRDKALLKCRRFGKRRLETRAIVPFVRGQQPTRRLNDQATEPALIAILQQCQPILVAAAPTDTRNAIAARHRDHTGPCNSPTRETVAVYLAVGCSAMLPRISRYPRRDKGCGLMSSIRFCHSTSKSHILGEETSSGLFFRGPGSRERNRAREAALHRRRAAGVAGCTPLTEYHTSPPGTSAGS